MNQNELSAEAEHRLASVVRDVLQLASDADLSSVAQESVQTWDSLAHVTMMLAIEGEFGVPIELTDSLELTSYAVIREFLAQRIT